MRAPEYLGITPLTGKFVKTVNNLEFMTICHKAGVESFSILLKENNTFKLKMNKALLISRHKPILNKNTHSLRLELFD